MAGAPVAFDEIVHGQRVANGHSIQLFARRRWFALLLRTLAVSAPASRAAVRELA
jgi:hypothetical protein